GRGRARRGAGRRGALRAADTRRARESAASPGRRGGRGRLSALAAAAGAPVPHARDTRVRHVSRADELGRRRRRAAAAPRARVAERGRPPLRAAHLVPLGGPRPAVAEGGGEGRVPPWPRGLARPDGGRTEGALRGREGGRQAAGVRPVARAAHARAALPDRGARVLPAVDAPPPADGRLVVAAPDQRGLRG